MNAALLGNRAALDQVDATLRDALAGKSTHTLLADAHALTVNPELVINEWVIAAHCLSRALLEEVQRRQEAAA